MGVHVFSKIDANVLAMHGNCTGKCMGYSIGYSTGYSMAIHGLLNNNMWATQ